MFMTQHMEIRKSAGVYLRRFLRARRVDVLLYPLRFSSAATLTLQSCAYMVWPSIPLPFCPCGDTDNAAFIE
jgi:hypothetical protein